MIVRGAVGAVGMVAGAGTAAAGGPDLVGIAALITSVVGAVTIAWTIWQAAHQKRQIDIEAAAALLELMEERRRRGSSDDET